MRTSLIPFLNGFFPRAAALCWWSNSAKFRATSEKLTHASLARQGAADDVSGADHASEPTLDGQSPQRELLPMLRVSAKNPSLGKSNTSYDIIREVYRQIERTLGCHLPERGGLLGGSRKDGLITHFWHDDSPLLANASTYEPNHIAVNTMLKQWNALGIDLIGMVHSHPGQFSLPSSADCEYARRILAHNTAMENFFMPIVLTRSASGSVRIMPYVVERESTLPFTLCGLRALSPAQSALYTRESPPKRGWTVLPSPAT